MVLRKWEAQFRLTKTVQTPWQLCANPYFLTRSGAERHVRFLKKRLALLDSLLGTEYRIQDRTK